MAKKKTKVTSKASRVYRDAATGRFVTKKYAKKNPRTTVKSRRSASTAVSENTA
jgi:hypothetical protein